MRAHKNSANPEVGEKQSAEKREEIKRERAKVSVNNGQINCLDPEFIRTKVRGLAVIWWWCGHL